MARLVLNLFGGFHASVDDQPLVGIYDHVRALLAYLVTEADRPHRREFLAELLWPEENEEVARRNLRQALSRLRAALGDRDAGEPFLLIDRTSIQFNARSDHLFDVAAFTACAPGDKQGPETELTGVDVPWLEEASRIYRGHFLDQFYLPDNPAFDQWASGRAEDFRQKVLLFLNALTGYHESAGNLGRAMEAARRQIELEPWREQAHRQLMRLLARAGQRGAALAQYSQCRELLQEELGVEPEPETEALRQAIQDGGLETAAAPQAAGKAASGRRQVTVLYCGLSEPAGMDPEDLIDIVRAFKQRCGEVAHRFEAHLENSHGGAQILFFGFPNAHEDDAQRAVHAGLRLQAEVRALAELHGATLYLRGGIHTGLMVVSDGESPDLPVDLVGTPVSAAVQLRYLAPANALLVSADTERLVRGGFVLKELELPETLELREALPAHQVVRAAQARARFEQSRLGRMTPFIGREQELETLLDHWAQARGGHGQLVVLEGEPGIGKSRIVHALRRRLLQESHLVRQLRCLPDYQTTALQPVVELLTQICELRLSDPLEARQTKLAGTLRELGLYTQENYLLLCNLLNLPDGRDLGGLAANPQQMKQRTLTLIADMQRQAAAQRPLLLVVEDLQWVDPSTLELLKLLGRQAAGVPMMILLTLRPGFNHPWSRSRSAARLVLASMSAPEVRRLAIGIARNKALPEAVLEQIVARTDGVPLFVEELTKTLLESNLLRETHSRFDLISASPSVALPFTLHDSLMARLDRLGSAKYVAQLGAVLGREFPADTLRAIAGLEETELRMALARLMDAELLYQRQVDTEVLLGFRHAMIQEVAYESLLRRHRQQLHRKVAETLEEFARQGQPARPEILARHYQEAGMPREAIRYWHQAGVAASDKSAHHEAIRHLQQGLSLLADLPDERERDQLELGLRMAMGVPLMFASGPVPEIEQAYARALELVQRMPEGHDVFPAIRGLYTYYAGRGDYPTALRVARQMLRVAEERRRTEYLLEGHRAVGTILLLCGELREAIHHLEFTLTLYDPVKHADLSQTFGMDPGLGAFSLLGIADWSAGYPERARLRVQEGVRLALERHHPPTLGWALNMGLTVMQLLGDTGAVLQFADILRDVADRHDIRLWTLWSDIMRDLAVLESRPSQALLDKLNEAFARYDRIGWAMGRPYVLALWAETCLRTGQIDQGLRVVRDALDWVNRHDARLHEAELWRLEGELLMTQENVPAIQVEAALNRALGVARKQGALGNELRIATTLGRLLMREGRAEEGYRVLEPLLSAFAETGEFKDLHQARLLAEALRERAGARSASR